MTSSPDRRVIHILNIDSVLTVAVDAADTLVGHQALPDLDVQSAIQRLKAVPAALDELVVENLTRARVLMWATRDDDTLRELTEAVSTLNTDQMGRVVAAAFTILTRAANWPTVLHDFPARTSARFSISPRPGPITHNKALRWRSSMRSFGKIILNRCIRGSLRTTPGCSVLGSSGGGPGGR